MFGMIVASFLTANETGAINDIYVLQGYGV
jgi:hypothetical protein